MLFTSLATADLPDQAEGVELRLDLFPWTLDLVQELLTKARYPLLLTHPKAKESEIEGLLLLNPPFFDLKHDHSQIFIERMITTHPQTKFILSYHNFQETPADLENLRFSSPAHHLKIACMAHSTNDALRLLLFAQKHPSVSVICMGDRGSFSRVLAPILGNPINYASKKEATAPGQLSVSELLKEYHYAKLNPNTAIYGLIGSPVLQSQSHLHHNHLFQQHGWNAVYVKMEVTSEELPLFFSLARQLSVRGLSVTMPLKEKVLPFLDEIDSDATQIGAVNTLVFRKDGTLWGTNTDGKGALDALGDVQDNRLVLLGAGGAARAIAFEAKRRGAEVFILNRTVEKAHKLGKIFGCQSGGLADFPTRYDLLINTTPSPLPIDPCYIQPHTRVMDISRSPHKTLFLQEASERGCEIIPGEEMFFAQATLQRKIWKSALFL